MEDTMTLGVEALAWMDNLVCEITRCPICIPNTQKKKSLFITSKNCLLKKEKNLIARKSKIDL